MPKSILGKSIQKKFLHTVIPLDSASLSWPQEAMLISSRVFFKLVVWLCVSAFIASRSTMTCFILSFRNGEYVVLPHMGVRDHACVACIRQAPVVSSFLFVFDMHIERVLDLILSIAII